MPIRHTTVATLPDEAGAEINKAEWNADHTLPDIADVTGLTVALAAKVAGPASATDNAIARYDSTTGKLIQNSAAFVSDTGQLSLGTASPDASAIMQADSTTQAFLGIPRMTTVQGDGIASPPSGLLYYNTEIYRFRFRAQFDWISLTPGASSPGFFDASFEDFFEATGNGFNKVRVKAPDSLASDVTATLPSTTGTLAIAGVGATISKTAAFTADTDGYTYRCSASGGAFAATLPAASSVTGRIYVFKKTDSSGNAVTVTRAGADTIDGLTTYSLSAQYKYVAIQSNGSGWDVIGNN